MELQPVHLLLIITSFEPSSANINADSINSFREYPVPEEEYVIIEKDLVVDGKTENNPGMDGASENNRYEDCPGWTECDPVELVRIRFMRLVQCSWLKSLQASWIIYLREERLYEVSLKL